MRLAVALAFAVLLFGVPYAAAQTPVDVSEVDETTAIVATIIDRAEAYGVDATLMVNVAWCESRFNRYAIGAQGEIGLFQLHPRGKLRTFVRYYDDPFDVWQQSDFAAWQFSEGQEHHWSCAR